MEREIKFRSWTVNANGVILNRMDYMSNQSIFQWESDGIGMFIMQFTGLKDRTGKAIYEGDIVEFNVDAGNEKEIINQIGKVIIGSHFTTFGNWQSFYCSSVLVVGNIYENPELIK